MKRLLIYLSAYKKETILAPLFKMLEAAFELLVPLAVVRIIDVGIASGDRGVIVRMCLIMVGLGIIGLSCSITAQYYSAKAAVGFAAKVKRALFQKIQRLSFTQLDEIGTATLVTRMTSDANQVQTGVNMTLRLLLRSPFIVFGAMIMAFTIDVQSAMVFAVVIPVLGAVVLGIMLVTIPMYRTVQQKLDGVTGAVRENLTGVRVIRAFGNERQQKERFEQRNERLTAMQNHVGKISACMNPATYAVINAAVIALLWTGALRVDGGAITQGQVVALYNYMSQILIELIKLANLIITVTKAVACGNRIASVLDVDTEEPADAMAETAAQIHAACAPDVPRVAFENVCFGYAGAEGELLTNISFTAGAGEVVGVIGGTGAGKSTLMQLILGAYPPTSGRIEIDGRDVRSYSRRALNEKIAIVMQKARLFTGTIRSNLYWGKPDATDDELLTALAIAQASEIVANREEGLDAPVAQGGKNFSGGQKQRLTIARALLRSPEILILDDSASALDYATDAALRKAIYAIKPRPTTFIVSQRTVSIQHADQILVLDEGKLVGCGTHETLLQSCPVYREIHESQFAGEARAQ